MKRCIVNFAKGGWYPSGQQRLRDSLATFGDGIDFLAFQDETQIGSPAHRDFPYAFKVYAIQEAFRRGFDSVLWLDSSMVAVAPVSRLFEILEVDEYGFLSFLSGHDCGTWTNDKMLKAAGITRDEAMKIPMLCAGIMGFASRPGTKDWVKSFLSFWSYFIAYFPGCHNNKNHTESADSRCQGHRHDQSAASLVASSFGFNLRPPVEFQYKGGKNEGAIILAQGP